ncbi:hypothetical protein FGM00_01670 [Aggregatimonas sangjinii]|uniref:Peptidase S8/S53 domain-containing protein n=1 Tax=Aggregatimonas sangjinii TaxID=2583587 RepID=A0A5B7SLF2_9FLAO|nr:S8 family serine peptidase [Aggregatimonas sangjinii]QCW98891.1 hypothetical protein FGM00_01670 [Aggregatimonas sangjinii]
MKTKITILFFTCLVVASCSKWPYGHGGDDDDDNIIYNEIKIDEGASSITERIEISPNEIVVRYDASSTLSERDNVRAEIRMEYPDVQIEECDCGDMDLWIFDPGIEELDIEGVVNGLPRRNPAGKVRGDRSFDIFLPEIAPFTPQGQAGGEPSFIAAVDNSSVNIAVIDTGIDYNRNEISSDTRRNLFPSGAFSDCLSTQSGWNYLGDGDENRINEGNQDILDQNGHGTYVTKIITDVLEEDGINYQILPLKVFNAEGKGSYWDVLCAFAYIKEINENGGNISVVNASFGGSMPKALFELDENGNKSLFAQLLDELNELNTLVVTSAGNKGVDNEIGSERDFLSFFDAANILAVGGYFDDGVRPVTDPVELDEDSNFGATSIDIALAFNDYKIILDTPDDSTLDDEVTLDGTSYAAAAMSAIAAVVIDEAPDLPPATLKQIIFSLPSASTSSELNGKIVESRALLRE